MDKSNVLITGGSGYFGSLLRDRLKAHGQNVRIFDISDAEDRTPDVAFVAGDIRDAAKVAQACAGCDTVCVLGWDPLAIPEAQRVMGDRMAYVSSAEDCVRRSKAVIIVNPLSEVSEIDWSQAGDAIVIDCSRCLPACAVAQLQHYVPLGQGPDRNLTTWMQQAVGEYFDLLTD